MPTSVTLSNVVWLAGATFSDTIGRYVDSANMYLPTQGGVLATGNGDMAVVAFSGMQIQVNPGTAAIPNSSGSGIYRVFNPSAATLTVPTAPVSPNTRIDLICATVVDNGNNTSFAEVQLVQGTASTSPVAPTLPTNSISLAQVAVGSGVVAITQANITDTRTWTTLAGGVVNCPNMASLPAGDTGTIGYDITNNRYFMLTSTGAKPFRVYPFAPAQVVGSTPATLTGVVGGTGTLNTISFGAQAMSQAITTDGSTDIEITIHWPGLSMATPTNTQVQFAIYRDAVQLDLIELAAGVVSGVTWGYNGGTHVYKTSAAAGDTPSAANHTITWKALAFQQSVSQPVQIDANTGHLAYLRVQPVIQ